MTIPREYFLSNLHMYIVQCTSFFSGKQVIHPGQIGLVQKAFTPPEHRLQWATQLIKVRPNFQVSTLKRYGKTIFIGKFGYFKTV